MKPKDERKRLYVYEKTTLRKYDVDKKVALVTRDLYEGNELESLRVPFFAMLAMVHDELKSRGLTTRSQVRRQNGFANSARPIIKLSSSFKL